MKQYHLTTIIDTVRHGEKDATGSLTQEGHRQAAMKALALEHVDGKTHIYHSGADRVRRTATMIKQLIRNSISDVQKDGFGEEVQACIDACSIEKSEEETIRNELHFLYDPMNKGTYFSTWSDAPTKEEATARAQALLDLHDTSPEEGIVPSPKEMAQRLSRLLLEQLEASLSTPLSEKNNYINGTHEPVLLSFIAYAFSSFEEPSNDIITQLGGAIDFVEGFHIKVYQSENGESLLTCSFRNFMISFSLEELRTFAYSV